MHDASSSESGGPYVATMLIFFPHSTALEVSAEASEDP